MKPLKKPKKHSDHANRHIFRNRLLIGGLLITLAFCGLFYHLFSLQIAHYDKYATLSDSNRIKLVPLPPTRGQIFDRNGEVLATNYPVYNIELIKQDIDRNHLDALLEDIHEIIPLTDDEISQFKRQLARSLPQDPVVLKSELTQEEIALLSVNLYRLNGVYINPEMVRIYPHKEVAVHAIGYVGRIDQKDMEEIEANHLTREYMNISHIGKRGSEKSFEDLLRGEAGYEKVETNSNGRIVRVIEEHPPTPGKDIYLTIDLRLQKLAEKVLGDYNGSVVAIDPNTGDILAFVSKPMYDPNLFVKGISQSDYNRLHTADSPFLNRVMQGRYPPGSVIKPQIALAGLSNDFITSSSTVNCNGSFQVPGNTHRFRDMGVHGPTNAHKAIERSCDVFFYSLAYEMGITSMTDFLTQFYLGRKTGIDLIGESPGVLPTPAYKQRTFKQAWYAGDSVTAGIGQSFWLTTPLQLAQMVSITAMRGETYVPHILHSHSHANSDERITKPLEPIEPMQVSSTKHWDTIIDSMVAVVHGNRGTARRINKGINYKIAGKTGTAQVKTIAQGERYNEKALDKRHRDHALFTAFAPADQPKIAISVVVENGGSGSGVAAPIAKEVIHAWLTDFREVSNSLQLNENAGE